MADILYMGKAGQADNRASRTGRRSNGADADIIIFPGVRYERSPTKPVAPKTVAHKSRKKHPKTAR